MRKLAVAAWALIGCAFSAPVPQSLGGGLYAYISDNDSSCNSVFLVGRDAILVVDTGFDVSAGEKLLSAIRSVSSLPVRYIVNTHYHRDHQAANGVVGPSSEVVSTIFTRERTVAMLNQHLPDVRFRPASIAITDAADIYLDDRQIHLEFPGPAHTMGDLIVYFPAQKVVATGDLFLNHSSPAMDKGSVLNWIHALEKMLSSPASTFVPGHFELGSRADLQRFHDYLADLRDQISAGVAHGTPWEQIRQNLNTKRFSDFRQFPNFHATFADNAAVIYAELTQKNKEKH